MATINTLSAMLCSFDNESEEEGEIASTLELNPQNFRIDMALSSSQFSKFLEFYSQPAKNESEELFFSKMNLNKINTIIHNHIGLLIRDAKLFRLYKNLMQIVTQDMIQWVDKDFHCCDVLLEILGEVKSHNDAPRFKKLAEKLRIDENIRKLVERSEFCRKMADDERLLNKRAKNFEKRQKKQVKVDPFDSIPLPVKRKAESSIGINEFMKIQKIDQEDNEFARPVFIDDICDTEFKAPKFEIDEEQKEDTLAPKIQKDRGEEKKEEHKNKQNEEQNETKKQEENEKSAKKESVSFETEEWFKILETDQECSCDEEINPKRQSADALDPRILPNIKCKGIDYVLNIKGFASKLPRFTIIINVKCLVSWITLDDFSKLNVKIPADSSKYQFKSKDYLASYRPGCKDFLKSIERFADVYIYVQPASKALVSLFLPGMNFIISKAHKFPLDLLIIFDNEKSGWHSCLILPILYYSPYNSVRKIFLHKELHEITNPAIINSCMEFCDAQLPHVINFLLSSFTLFLENSCENCAFYECWENLKTVFVNIKIDYKEYEKKVGRNGLSDEKLKIYLNMVKALGGSLEEGADYMLVEEKFQDKQVSGKWIVECFLRYSYCEKY